MNKEQRLQNRIKSLERKLNQTKQELSKIPKWIRKLFGVNVKL